jgi:hypothetical protein
MSELKKLFYTLLLWATSFELAIAKKAPHRNHRHIEALQSDESEYQRELIRMEVGL